jgi:hypothetical protein
MLEKIAHMPAHDAAFPPRVDTRMRMTFVTFDRMRRGLPLSCAEAR